MLELTPDTDLRALLRESIRDLKKSKPNLSSSALAGVLKIAVSTFGRIENGEVKRPDVATTTSIISACHGEKAVKDVLAKFYPEIAVNIDRVYKGNKEVPFIAPDAEKYFRDPSTHELMVAVTSNSGLTRESVQVEYGKRGLTALDDLIANGIVEEKTGKISLSGKINARQETVHQLVQNLVTHNYDLDSFGKKQNWLSLQYESVDLEKARPEIVKILQEAQAKLRTVFNSPEYQGNDVVWAALASDTLIKQAVREEVLQ